MAAQAPPTSGFVRVAPGGGGFVEADGRPFHVAGCNCYYLLTRAADPGLRHECAAVLDAAAAAGLRVVRTWAFADGGECWNALQQAPGVYDERVFRALDWLLHEAAQRGLRLLLVLTNYWADYGGMRQYVRWAAAARGEQPPAAPDGSGTAAEPFYSDPACQQMFRAFMQRLTSRVSTLSGRRYRDEPAILAWGLANEPRCEGDAGAGTVARWAADTAAFLKRCDANHMVALDSEGFLGPSTPAEAASHNPYDCSATGCDFAAEAACPALDFCCCHSYPDLWLPPSASAEDRLRFALRWMDCHVRLARRLGKPLLMSEWGKRRQGVAPGGGRRADCYRRVLAHALEHMRSGGLAGHAFWMLAAPSYPDHDGFTVYLGSSAGNSAGAAAGGTRAMLAPAAPPPAAGHGHTAAAIRAHAAAVAELDGRPAAAAAGVPPPSHAALNPLLLPPASGGAPGGSGSAAGGGVSSACPCCQPM